MKTIDKYAEDKLIPHCFNTQNLQNKDICSSYAVGLLLLHPSPTPTPNLWNKLPEFIKLHLHLSFVSRTLQLLMELLFYHYLHFISVTFFASSHCCFNARPQLYHFDGYRNNTKVNYVTHSYS